MSPVDRTPDNARLKVCVYGGSRRDGTPLATPTQFAEVFRHELLPLLQEFAYEDFGELARYLGSDLIDREAQALTVDPTNDPEGLLTVLAAEFQRPTST